MFRYKNTTLYNLMKINYVYVIHYVDHLFVIRHCDEADELLTIVWCHYDEENKIETLYRKTHCKLYTVPILFIQFRRGLYVFHRNYNWLQYGSTRQRIHGSPLPINSSRKFEKLMAFKKIMWCNFRGWTRQILRMI